MVRSRVYENFLEVKSFDLAGVSGEGRTRYVTHITVRRFATLIVEYRATFN